MVHPVGSDFYYFQPSVIVDEDGKWKGQAFIGRDLPAGAPDLGHQFEIGAFASPRMNIAAIREMPSWVPAEYVSDIITVTRERI
jgi:hypothetical protein